MAVSESEYQGDIDATADLPDDLSLTLVHLYPLEMSIYGDRGNIIAINQRCRWRGIDLDIKLNGIGDSLEADKCDLVFFGGGQDQEQIAVSNDLQGRKGEELKTAVEAGAALLAVCGGYQLLGKHFQTKTELIPGIGLFDAWTVAGPRRQIGDLLAESTLGGQKRTLVGFENHSGRTFLGAGAAPLARVLVGSGNNGDDGWEGVVHGSAIGTYLHGSVLPKNPWLVDHLIEAALHRRYGRRFRLPALDDQVETMAHRAVADRIRRRGKLASGAV
ncbi:MAG TPA: glutamine amidotransferase [Chloroflexota bacterium]|nr:glutamine amidotransferase [Chloroflexota bacterium]